MPDEQFGGATLGLSDALQQYCDRQLETRRRNGGKGCPGEEICEKIGTPTGNMGLRDKSRPIEAICDQCSLRHTKPGTMPGHLSSLIVRALELDEIKESGGTFTYPDTLSPLEWCAVRALERARRTDREKDFQNRKAAADQSSEQARLQARLSRG